jgi:hypothetical protein
MVVFALLCLGGLQRCQPAGRCVEFADGHPGQPGSASIARACDGLRTAVQARPRSSSWLLWPPPQPPMDVGTRTSMRLLRPVLVLHLAMRHRTGVRKHP